MTTTTQFSNNASSTLLNAISAATTSVTLASGTGSLYPVLSTGQIFYATFIKAATLTSEIVKVTSTSGDTFTVVRAQGGTTALTFSAGDRVELRVTAASAANWESKFEDYATGTWVPVDASGAVTVSYTSARYTKLGKLVTVTCLGLTYPTTISAVAASINGLPYVCGAEPGTGVNFCSSTNGTFIKTVPSASTISFFPAGSLTLATNAQMSGTTSSFTFSYLTT